LRDGTGLSLRGTMITRRSIFIAVYWAVTGVALAGAVGMLLWYTPTEATMGPVQKIFYLHLPVAIATFLACAVCFVASIGYLAQRQMWWDDLASAAARVAVVLCAVVLLTGMIWGKSAWGAWWTWSPRLTFSLLLFLLYIVYVMVRSTLEPGERRALVSAVYGIIAFLDVPLVYLSVRMMPDIHPTSIELAPAMRWTLLVWFVPVLLLAMGLIAARYELNGRERRQRVEASEAALGRMAPTALRGLRGSI
jgi:heme exporter protein C